MRALVVGASGQVGAALSVRLAARGHRVIATHHRTPAPSTRQLDFTDAAATERIIDETRPDWIFCAAGLIHVDYCEEVPAEAYRANRDAPAAAARLAARRGARFIYYSTEYVFDGRAGPYGEADQPDPLSVYGRSKLEGERAVVQANPGSLVVRTTVVYGPEPQGKNFVYQLLRRLRAGERMTVAVDQRSSPTYNEDLAAASVELAERGVGGVIHVAGPDILDRYAFARTACEVFDLDPESLTPVPTAELSQRAPRPLNAGLRTDRARALLTTPLRGPREGLEAMRRALAEGASVDTPGGRR
ncbi:MAG TPA: dTDP-4-dehydrorhamnose reductase [Methylomirabilota bacterium]|nr:dTDP-4-dehydrorhamnose reductase [Methylomirabilota bacterium]